MFNFLNGLLKNSVLFTIVICVLAALLIAFVIFVVYQLIKIKRISIENKQKIANAQERLFIKSAELLSAELIKYTDEVLYHKINEHYSKLVTNDLLPSVNEAVLRMTQMSEKVIASQEQTIKDLSISLADSLGSQTKNYIDEESQILSTLNHNVVQFSDELYKIAGSMNAITTLSNESEEKTNLIFQNIAQLAELLNSKIDDFGKVIEAAAFTASKIESVVEDNGEIANAMVNATNQSTQTAIDTAALISAQNEKTVEILDRAVDALQSNMGNVIKNIMSEFSYSFNETGDNLAASLSELKAISLEINRFSSQFSDSISRVYSDFGENFNESIKDVSDSIARSVTAECGNIISGAEKYSEVFTNNINQFSSELSNQISNLQMMTEKLSSNIEIYQDHVDESAQNFEMGMEKSISNALSQIDNSLAEIVQRLVYATTNIQDAADALPKAVSAFKK